MTDNERKESISALRQLLAMCDFVDQYGDSIDADPYFDAAEIAIESLNETRWIPVNERLPSQSGWYFVTVQGMERVSDMVWYYHESHEWNVVSETQKVLAWMPLPKPYREDGEEE